MSMITEGLRPDLKFSEMKTVGSEELVAFLEQKLSNGRIFRLLAGSGLRIGASLRTVPVTAALSEKGANNSAANTNNPGKIRNRPDDHLLVSKVSMPSQGN